jgi:transcription elongation GreA/GreB family factor
MYRDDQDEVEQVVIVPHEEADFASGLISTRSPLAQALLGHVAGDPIRARTPGGIRVLEILAIEPAR